MQKLNSLMQQEMTRKEFLTTLGFGTATVFGLSTLLQFFGKANPFQQSVSQGYSSGSYGGIKRTLQS